MAHGDGSAEGAALLLLLLLSPVAIKLRCKGEPYDGMLQLAGIEEIQRIDYAWTAIRVRLVVRGLPKAHSCDALADDQSLLGHTAFCHLFIFFLPRLVIYHESIPGGFLALDPVKIKGMQKTIYFSRAAGNITGVGGMM